MTSVSLGPREMGGTGLDAAAMLARRARVNNDLILGKSLSCNLGDEGGENVEGGQGAGEVN